ncbi:hypothetical protein FIBSPDRAFT_952263 [Athelia psychrophila]|uniref:Uncharacterized protein n=1 Tax=Athelia psychrophila TaxID=1759441 RepID=A0A166LQ30_9AGAM|nr:hypothetical protein FIBSPDRAFT_952263 [Fibularhizoctonia sp. CBS 109695]
MVQFRIPSFAIFNNIVLFALYAVVCYILLRAIFKPFFSSQGHPWSVTRVTRVLATSGPTTTNAIYAPHYASNHLAFFQPEIHGFTHGLVKTLDSKTPLLSCLSQAKYSASESIPDRPRSRHRFRGHATDEMSRSPDTVAKLQAEPDASMPEPLAIPDIRVLQHLPYLSPFIKDDLRVHGAVPSLPERVLPSHLQKQLGPCTRDPTAFPPALTFLPDPDRWLSAIEDQLAQMQAHIMPFRMGSWIGGNGARDDDDASPGTLRSMRRKGRMRRGLFSSGKEDGDTHGTDVQVVHAGANSPIGTRILPTWPMYSRASGGGRPLNLSKNKQQGKLRKATETHRFQNGVRHIAPTIPTPMPRNVIPVCSALNPCLAKMSGKAWNAILGSSACHALRRRVMWSYAISSKKAGEEERKKERKK